MPHIIGIQGNLGAGKTTTGVTIAYLYKNAIEAAGGHVELFANCEMKGAQIMSEPEDWFKVASAHGSICLWDEAHRSFDSRRATSYQNILATEILTFVRKMMSIQIFITPSIGRLDNRIREMLEVLINVRKNGTAGISLEYFDFQAQNYGQFGQFLHKRFLPASKIKQIHKLNLFDSHSFVRGFPLPKTERAAEHFMSELERYHNEGRTSKREGFE